MYFAMIHYIPHRHTALYFLIVTWGSSLEIKETGKWKWPTQLHPVTRIRKECSYILHGVYRDNTTYYKNNLRNYYSDSPTYLTSYVNFTFCLLLIFPRVPNAVRFPDCPDCLSLSLSLSLSLTHTHTHTHIYTQTQTHNTHTICR